MFSSSCGETFSTCATWSVVPCLSAPCLSISPSFCIATHISSFAYGHWCQSHFSSSHASCPLEYPQCLFSASVKTCLLVQTVIHSRFIPLVLFFPRIGHSNCKQTDASNLAITDFPQVQFVRIERWDTHHLKAKRGKQFICQIAKDHNKTNKQCTHHSHEARETGESNISTSTACKPDGLLSTENTIVEHLPPHAKGTKFRIAARS